MIPKFKFFIRPILEALPGKRQMSKNEIHDFIVDYFSLAERDETALTKGGNNVLDSRISWAFVYFEKSGSYRQSCKGKGF